MAGMKDLKKKVIVVTGAGSGIGRAIAHRFAEEDAWLVISDIHKERLNIVEEEIRSYGVKVAVIISDVADLKQVNTLAEFAIGAFGRVDILVNNAGIGWGGPSDVFPIEDFEKVMAVNFWGVIYGMQVFLPVMKRQKNGHIVNIASGAGLNAIAGLGAYSASKHAVVGYSEALRAELHRYNIGITAICPGIINTNVVRDGKATQPEGMKFDHSKMIVFYKKWGWPPERVADAVVKAVRKNKGIVPVGPEAWILWFIKRFSQALWELYLRLSVKIAF